MPPPWRASPRPRTPALAPVPPAAMEGVKRNDDEAPPGKLGGSATTPSFRASRPLRPPQANIPSDLRRSPASAAGNPPPPTPAATPSAADTLVRRVVGPAAAAAALRRRRNHAGAPSMPPSSAHPPPPRRCPAPSPHPPEATTSAASPWASEGPHPPPSPSICTSSAPPMPPPPPLPPKPRDASTATSTAASARSSTAAATELPPPTLGGRDREPVGRSRRSGTEDDLTSRGDGGRPLGADASPMGGGEGDPIVPRQRTRIGNRAPAILQLEPQTDYTTKK